MSYDTIEDTDRDHALYVAQSYVASEESRVYLLAEELKLVATGLRLQAALASDPAQVAYLLAQLQSLNLALNALLVQP